MLEFARDLEERTDGAIRIEFIGDNQICGQLNCFEKAQLVWSTSMLRPHRTRQVPRRT